MTASFIKDVTRSIRAARDAEEGVFPLAAAAAIGDYERCRLLLEAGADPNKGGNEAHSTPPLCQLLRGRNPRNKQGKVIVPENRLTNDELEAFVLLFLQHGARIDGPAVSAGDRLRAWASPIHVSVEAGDHEAVSLLARLGANLNPAATIAAEIFSSSPGDGMRSPLVRALWKRDYLMVVTLLRSGADDAKLGNREFSRSPFHICVINGYDDVVEYYVKERGEDLAQRIDSKTLLQAAKIASTRVLLRSLKAEFAVKCAMDSSGAGGKTMVAPKKGMAPL